MIKIINGVTIDINKDNNMIDVYDDEYQYYDCPYLDVTHEEVYKQLESYINSSR